jgi:hypothetical protein
MMEEDIPNCEHEPTQAELVELWRVMRNEIRRIRITSPESIYQTDRVIEGAYEFIDKCCGIVGYVREED